MLDLDEATRLGEAITEFNKQVNATLVDPKYIAKVRKKLKLDQREAAGSSAAASMRSPVTRQARRIRRLPS